jgi:hypothetical protein
MSEPSKDVPLAGPYCSDPAWLYTIGFLHLSFWRGVLALVIWPYYLGAHFAR